MTKTELLKELNISDKSYAELLKMGIIVPDIKYKNPYNKKKFIYIFEDETVKKIKTHKEIVARRKKKKGVKDWNSIFFKRYNDKKDALLDVANAMFNLNRYAKHKSCTAENKEEIYQLKNSLIKYLYQNNFSESIAIHSKPEESKPCYYCKGKGFTFSLETCHVCDGDGYLIYPELKFYVFSFLIGGNRFTWHQPEKKINYEIKKIEGESELNETEVKPMEVKKHKLTELKKLVSWFLDYD